MKLLVLRLKSLSNFKMYCYFVDGNSKYKKAKDVNKNVVETTCHNEHKNILLNKKCLRHSMNRVQIKIILQELAKSTRFLCLALMIKYIFKILDVID